MSGVNPIESPIQNAYCFIITCGEGTQTASPNQTLRMQVQHQGNLDISWRKVFGPIKTNAGIQGEKMFLDIKTARSSLVSALFVLVTLGITGLSVMGASNPLGSAQNFAILGASTVTNTGLSMVKGHVGVSPGTAVTGFPPGVVTGGAVHAGDAIATQAHTDATVAYAALVNLACPAANNLTGQDLGGLTLAPGVYCFNSSAFLTGP